MATTQVDSTDPATEFRVDARERVDDEAAPRHVLVEVIQQGRGLTAIVAGGEAGRFSFDFQLVSGEIEIDRAYIEGVQVRTDELPAWIAAVREAIEGTITE